jgi:hypothetical protein
MPSLVMKLTYCHFYFQNNDLVFNVCFQNPEGALEALLRQAVRSQRFKALKKAKPYFNLQRNQPDIKTGNCVGIIIVCWRKLLEKVDGDDAFWDSLIEVVPALIENCILHPQEIFETVKSLIFELSVKNEIQIEKIVKLMGLLEALTIAITEINDFDEDHGDSRCQLLKRIADLADGTITFTSALLNIRTYKPMLAIRRHCLKIKDKAYPSGPPALVSTPKLRDLSMESLGFLFIRDPRLRPHIKSFFNKDDVMYFSYEEAVDTVLCWFLNSEPDLEWSVLIEFVNDVLLPNYQDSWGSKTLSELTRHCTLEAYRCSVGYDDPFIVRQWLKFYKEVAPIVDKKNQLELIDSLVTLAISIDKGMKKRLTWKHKSADDITAQQVLLLLLDVLNLIVAGNKDFDTTIRDDVLDRITLLPRYVDRCEPIWKCILERIIKDRNTKMLPLPSDVTAKTMKVDEFETNLE